MLPEHSALRVPGPRPGPRPYRSVDNGVLLAVIFYGLVSEFAPDRQAFLVGPVKPVLTDVSPRSVDINDDPYAYRERQAAMTVRRPGDDPLERLSIAPTVVWSLRRTARPLLAARIVLPRCGQRLHSRGDDALDRSRCGCKTDLCQQAARLLPVVGFQAGEDLRSRRCPAHSGGGVASGAISTGTYGSALRWRTGSSRGCACGLPARSRTASAWACCADDGAQLASWCRAVMATSRHPACCHAAEGRLRRAC
jgi:hypothetical protein